MKCYTCGKQIIKHTGNLELASKALGRFTIYNVLYFKCADCEELLFPDETWKIADQVESEEIERYLRNLPLKSFVGASRASSILGMSRQALHKHRRIRRGFIYSIMHEGKILYHDESVELFKETGDGRFPLNRDVPKKELKYIVLTIPFHSDQKVFHDFVGKENVAIWNKPKVYFS